jgi:2-succinyl-6-hydroxy-2,4-cyclohexadiene-1-carboxylate synthase
VALQHPQKVKRLVLLSATRGIRDEDERQARRDRDELLAQRIEQIGAENFIDEWLAQPMFEALPNDSWEREARRGQNASGLASSLRLAGTGTQAWLGDEIKQLSMPVLLLAGERDEKFVNEAEAMAKEIPNARCLVISGAGHAAHVEQPDAVARAILHFLEIS